MRTQGPTKKTIALQLSLASPLPLPRGEDEGEAFKRSYPKSILTLPLSLQKGEAAQRARAHSTIPAQT